MPCKNPNKPFLWPVRVYYEDTDAQGLVYYANYFRFMERARTEWLRALGVEQDALLRDERRLFVVVDTRAEFLQPARFNDQLIVTVETLSRGRVSFELKQCIYRNAVDSELLIRSTTHAACLNADTLKAVRLPSSLQRFWNTS